MNATTQTLPQEVDTIIIGAGTGGSACAGVLAAHSGEHILVLEAGPDYGAFSDGNWPADMLSAKAIPLSHDYDLVSVTGADLPRASIVGGCSAHNGCTTARSALIDYDDWAQQGNPGWEGTVVEPLLDWCHSRLRVRRYRQDELTVAQAAFVGAGTRVGLPWADDLDDAAAAEGIGPMPVNIVDGVRWNAAFAFLDPVRDRKNLQIVGNTTVDTVNLEDGQVRSVTAIQADGTRATIEAKRVIVAAGAYHSPTILQRSGIGPEQVLKDVGVSPVQDLAGVGRNLLDHACVQLDFHGREGLLEELAEKEWNPDEQSLGRAKSSVCDDGPYDIHVFMVAGANSGHPGLPPITLYGGAMRARSGGTVSITSADPAANPVIDHAYLSDAEGHDRTVLSDALSLLHKMTEDEELAAVLGEPSNADRDPLDHIASYCHPAGTCKMGPNSDPDAVVDHTGQVHGVSGLYVADGSIMPAITRGNINLPIAMIGARIAANLLDLDPATVAKD